MEYKLKNRYKADLEKQLNRLCCHTMEAVVDLEMFFYPLRDPSVHNDSFAFKHSLDIFFERALLSIRKLVEPSQKNDKATLNSIGKIILQPDFYLIPDEDSDWTDVLRTVGRAEEVIDLAQRHAEKFFQKNYGDALQKLSKNIMAFLNSEQALRIKDYRDYSCHILLNKPKSVSFEIYDNMSNTLNKTVDFLSRLHDFVFDEKADFFKQIAILAPVLAENYWKTINEGAKLVENKKQERETLAEILKRASNNSGVRNNQ
ncbi:MAG: hypothetical protein LBJ73_00460 [Rickettsiales bacterium]|nr:hypothetical protein [Rickettsiales bacterium]